VSLVVAWVDSHSGATTPIIGARNVDQLREAVAAVDIEMTEELRQQISNLSPESPPATDCSEEKNRSSLSYPVTGNNKGQWPHLT
jgi:diketogulonate reductase-like aldo/keto reductase